MFEQQGDLENEREVIDEVCKSWGCTAKKLPARTYKVDWLLSKFAPVAFAEVKCRRSCYDPYLIALHKFETLVRLSNIAKVKALIVVRWDTRRPDIHWIDVSDGSHNGLRWLEDSRRREDADAEPCVALQLSRFHTIKISLR